MYLLRVDCLIVYLLTVRCLTVYLLRIGCLIVYLLTVRCLTVYLLRIDCLIEHELMSIFLCFATVFLSTISCVDVYLLIGCQQVTSVRVSRFCPDDIVRTAQPFVTKLGVVLCHREPVYHTTRLVAIFKVKIQ